jgi:hypothetical protein
MGILVASQVLNQFEIESSQPFMLRDILPGAAWAPYRAPTRPLAPDTDRVSDANEKGEKCLKGFVVAVCLEGAMALGVFGLWHVWHLIR